jgi:protein phosphatase
MSHSDRCEDETRELSLSTDPELFFGRRPTPVTPRFAARSHRGLVRERNEDHYVVVRRSRRRDVLLTSLPAWSLQDAPLEAYTLVLADGMGGLEHGELASRMVLEAAWRLGGVEMKWPLLTGEAEVDELEAKLQAYGRLLNRMLQDFAGQYPTREGMGTTMTAAYTFGTDACIAHIGDSRCYLYRQGRLFRLTSDHTLAEQLAAMGAMKPGSRELAHYRHVLVNCLNSRGEDVRVEVQRLVLGDADRLFLCSDGLTDMVDDETIREVLAERTDPEDACDRLIELALAGGGRDNVTVLLGDYHFASPTDAESRSSW